MMEIESKKQKVKFILLFNYLRLMMLVMKTFIRK
jgi:hypothetical protein